MNQQSSLIDQRDLLRLEQDVQQALAGGDRSSLRIIGYGEVSVALGYPSDEPAVVCKRTPPMTDRQFRNYQQLVERYVAGLDARGVQVAETQVRSVVRKDDDIIGYLVQPLVDSETLGEKVLERSEPDADHPFLVALAATIALADDRLSLDAQVTNWSWHNDSLLLLDVGTPFMWDQNGALIWDMTPIAKMGPALFRSYMIKDITKVITRWQSPRGVAVDVVANLYREKLEDWIPATLEAMNRMLGTANAITAEEGHAMYLEDAKTFPLLKKMQIVERAWQTKVRRRGYDFFVQESTFH